MGLILEDLYDHEGYAARRLPDGTLTGTWTQATREFDAYVGACGCGWRGDVDYLPTELGEEFAIAQWRLTHAEPLLACQAERRRDQLARVLAWLGSQRDQLQDRAAMERVGRAIDRAADLVADVQRDLERQVPQREPDDER
jgi:hypothetical protein